ncbi:MAG: hypothetical protein ABI406_01630 [Ktedonobacteraceae bacterium]
MNQNLIPNIVSVALFTISAVISLRAFYIYSLARNPRIFILGLTMATLALTAIADFASSNITSIALNTDWFLFIGQAASFLFIFLSLMSSSNKYLQRLMLWNIGVSTLLLALLLFSTTLPNFPNTTIKILLSGSRSVFCFGIFFAYVSAFVKKETRFSLLMSVSFLLLSLGYLMIAQQFLTTNQLLFDNIGDITRLIGLIILLIAIIAG